MQETNRVVEVIEEHVRHASQGISLLDKGVKYGLHNGSHLANLHRTIIDHQLSQDRREADATHHVVDHRADKGGQRHLSL